MIIFFIMFVGKAVQCSSHTGCVPVPYEAVAYMVQFGILELFMEIGVYKFYRKKTKKDDDEE